MNPSAIKTAYQDIDPAIGGAFQGDLSDGITVYELTTGICNSWDTFLSNLVNALRPDDLQDAISTLNSLFNAIGPLFDIFGEVNEAMNEELCMPNPIEAAREAGERVREAGEKAAEWASEK